MTTEGGPPLGEPPDAWSDIAEAVEQERRRLARDLHDGITQDLAALGYALDAVIASAETGSPDVPAALRELRGRLTATVRELRSNVGALRTGVTPDRTLGGSLTDAAHQLADQCGWRLHVDVSESAARLPGDVEAELFRITQEALRNVEKHARADHVWLTCHVDDQSARIQVADDGIGLGTRSTRPDSYGFVTMAERADQVGASLSVQERQPAGTVVEVWFDSSGGRTSGRP